MVTDPADLLRQRGIHHHLICRVCGRLVDVDSAAGSARTEGPDGPVNGP